MEVIRSKAAIVGVSGLKLTDQEIKLFKKHKPFGFILFARNCETPNQVRSLIKQMRALVGWECPVLIDQEGGRVSRLKTPEWDEFPAPSEFLNFYKLDPYLGQKKAYDNAKAMSAQLVENHINVNCTPLLDLLFDGTHDVIGDRSFGDDPFIVAFLAARVVDGHYANGVIPIIKHLPGHGRAKADSHLELPVVDVSMRDLVNHDFQAFRLMVSNMHSSQCPMPWGMTAHILYTVIDSKNCATHSKKLIDTIIRQHIGFDGFLLTDCLSMEALKGSYKDRVEKALNAGCDTVLYCPGKINELTEVLESASILTDEGMRRYEASLPYNYHQNEKKVSIN